MKKIIIIILCSINLHIACAMFNQQIPGATKPLTMSELQTIIFQLDNAATRTTDFAARDKIGAIAEQLESGQLALSDRQSLVTFLTTELAEFEGKSYELDILLNNLQTGLIRSEYSDVGTQTYQFK